MSRVSLMTFALCWGSLTACTKTPSSAEPLGVGEQPEYHSERNPALQPTTGEGDAETGGQRGTTTTPNAMFTASDGGADASMRPDASRMRSADASR